MLKIVVPAWEDFDPATERIIRRGQTPLTMEHSLVSISKWESKYHKAWLSDDPKTDEEMLDYIRFMTITNPNKEVHEDVYKHLSYDNLKAIEQYISDPMTATKIHREEGKGRGRKQIITSELIYYWMTALGIPFECQRWHLNRLLTLIEVAGVKNQPSKKMSRSEIMAQNRSLNAARRAKHHSRG